MRTGRARSANHTRAGGKPANDRRSDSGKRTGAAEDKPDSPRPNGAQGITGRTEFRAYFDNIRLQEPKEEDFINQSDDELQRFLEQSKIDFFTIIEEFRMHANIAGEQFKDSSSRHEKWRKWSIIATGGLAALNG